MLEGQREMLSMYKIRSMGIQVSVIGETANIIGSEPWGSSAYWHLSGLLQFVVLTFGGLEVAGSIFVKKCPEVSST